MGGPGRGLGLGVHDPARHRRGDAAGSARGQHLEQLLHLLRPVEEDGAVGAFRQRSEGQAPDGPPDRDAGSVPGFHVQLGVTDEDGTRWLGAEPPEGEEQTFRAGFRAPPRHRGRPRP